MSIYVFLGPTMKSSEAAQLLEAVYLPPVGMGDVLDLLRKKPTAIAIVDGYFDQVPSVWHKEILLALEAGVPVFGASSMGALRAAELAPFGMRGVGTIFDWFRSGVLEDDDEVTVAHGAPDDEFRPLSDAMVNIRHGLARACAEGVICAPTRDALVAMAKRTFYADRSWDRLLHSLRGLGAEGPAEADALRGFLRREQPNLKRDDAALLLARLREEMNRGFDAPVNRVRVERTRFLRSMVASAERVKTRATGAMGQRCSAIRDYVRAMRPDAEHVFRACLLWVLVEREAKRLGLAPDSPRLKRAVDDFRRRRELGSTRATEEWLRANCMDRRDLLELVTRELQLADVLQQHSAEVEALVISELRLRGELAETLRHLEDRERRLGPEVARNPRMEDSGANYATVLNWYEQRVGKMHDDLDGFARARGFASTRAFLAEVIADFAFHRVASSVSEAGSNG